MTDQLLESQLYRVALPGGTEFYRSLNNERVFFLRNSDGSLTLRRIVYIVRRHLGHAMQVYGVALSSEWTLDECIREIQDCADEFSRKLNDGTARIVSTDGGSLGTGDNKLTKP